MVSVIIPTLNRPDLLANCLESIGDGPEVIVVDEGLSYGEHCNLGAQRASGDVFVFLNDDTEVSPGWLDALTRSFIDERVGIVGCRLVYPDGKIQHAGVYFESPGGVLTARNQLLDAQSRWVEAVTGACMAVRAETFDQLGGFDVGYVNGYEDVDLCLAARRDGWRIWYTNETTVVHHESQSGRARWTHVNQNVQRLQEKWAA